MMTEKEEKMMNEIISLRLKLLLADIGVGNCAARMSPLRDNVIDCDSMECNPCRRLWIQKKLLEITEDVKEEYGGE